MNFIDLLHKFIDYTYTSTDFHFVCDEINLYKLDLFLMYNKYTKAISLD